MRKRKRDRPRKTWTEIIENHRKTLKEMGKMTLDWKNGNCLYKKTETNLQIRHSIGNEE